MTLEDIGEGNDALLCRTNLTSCCQSPNEGNWVFPNGTRVTMTIGDFYIHRGEMVIHLNRRRGGVDGIYRCEITDSMKATQTIYIGVYTTSSGESATLVLFNHNRIVMYMCCRRVRVMHSTLCAKEYHNCTQAHFICSRHAKEPGYKTNERKCR